MSASRPPPTPFRATSKPFTASSKTSSSTWNRSPVAAISSPKLSPTSSTSILPRPNTHKQNLSPWQIVEQLQPRWPLQLCLNPPVFLDYFLNDAGGYDLPRHPYGGLGMSPHVIIPDSLISATEPTAAAAVVSVSDAQTTVVPCQWAGSVHIGYAARSLTSAEVEDRAQWAQQKNRPPTSTPCPITLHLQCSQIGA